MAVTLKAMKPKRSARPRTAATIFALFSGEISSIIRPCCSRDRTFIPPRYPDVTLCVISKVDSVLFSSFKPLNTIPFSLRSPILGWLPHKDSNLE